MARTTAEMPRPIAWMSTLLLVVIGGLALWAARSPLAETLDGWLTLPRWQAEAPIIEVAPERPVEAPPETPEETGPVWTFETIEEALAPLPDQVQQLSQDARREQQDFADLARRDAPQALQKSRWENWQLVWKNRTAIPRQAMPPVDLCRPHAALEATCLTVEEALQALESIAELPDATQAVDALDRADAIFEAWRAAKEAAEAAAAEAEALAAEALANQTQEAGDLTDEILDATDAEENVEVEDLLNPDG